MSPTNDQIEAQMRRKGLTPHPTKSDVSCGSVSIDAESSNPSIASETPETPAENQQSSALEKCEAIAKVLLYVESAKKPGQAAKQIAWACGMFINLGKGIPELAAECGISKQAFHAGAMRFVRLLELDASRAMRFESTRETFRKTNYIKPK